MATVTNENEASGQSDHVIVCGMGHVGYRIVRLLMRLGFRGAIIALNVKADWRAEVEPDFSVIVGDARDDALLRKAGIERARAILAVTSDDLANVSIALDAQRMNPAISVTARIFDLDLAGHLERAIDIDRALSASALAVPAFVAAALGGSVQGAFEFEGTQWVIDSEAVSGGRPAEIAGIAGGREASRVPIALERGNELSIRPGSEVKFAAGDRVTFLSPSQSGQSGAVSTASQSNWRVQSRALLAGLGEWWRETPMALRITIFALLGLIAASVAIFHVALGISFVDALFRDRHGHHGGLRRLQPPERVALVETLRLRADDVRRGDRGHDRERCHRFDPADAAPRRDHPRLLAFEGPHHCGGAR